MDNSDFSLPVLTQEQQDIFSKAFSEDSICIEKLNRSFLKSLLSVLRTVTPSILTAEESSTLLKECSNPLEKLEAISKFMKEKGTGAILVFYLLLKTKDETSYKELPSYKAKDEKEKLLTELEDRLPLSQKQKEEISGKQEEVNPPDDTRKAKSNVAAVKPMVHEKQGKKEAQQDVTERMEKDLKKRKAESQPIGERRTRNAASDQDIEKPLPHRWPRKGLNPQKGDHFFHFLLFCFSAGAALVCFYMYTDWIMAAGIGLISFASLEVIGSYPGLVKSIHAVLEGLLSMWQRIPVPGIFRPKTS
ncbi:transmembrane protein 40 [Microcaecilia unicolor]|uniref:Transmembrane protein 40 n=1 Tax=Microcaecilia unicolor TaxID=1415580 RepID=A0A6P7YFT7_9AMPH|nr:transmembrane protein 40 [Microcaecilia unicolor]